MGDLEAPRLTLHHVSSELSERLDEEAPDEVGLQATRRRPFHLLPNLIDLAAIKGICTESPIPQKLLEMTSVERVRNHALELRLDFRSVPLSDCLEEKFAKRTLSELDAPKNVKHFAPPMPWSPPRV